MGDELPNEALVLSQRVAQSHDLLHEAGGVRDRHHDRPVITFDPLRQRDFFVARQEGNPAHLGEIHSHDVAGGVAPARGQVNLVRIHASAPCIRSLERLRVDVDAGVLTLVEQVDQHHRRGDVDRQSGVDLVAAQVSLLLSESDELPDGRVLFTARLGGPVCS